MIGASNSSDITYAIGDVHGRADLLRELLQAISKDADGDRYRVVFLGDIIDRGPQSKQAMDIVAETITNIPGSTLVLGNHDEFLLRFLDAGVDQKRFLDRWRRLGGYQTLASYGLGDVGAATAAKLLLANFPEHIELLRHAPEKLSHGDYVFVHAGLRPGVAWGEQHGRDLRWIREEFLTSEFDFGKTVVHGHSITAGPEIHSNRIAIDTGAFETGRLTALRTCPTSSEVIFLSTLECGRRIDVQISEPAWGGRLHHEGFAIVAYIPVSELAPRMAIRCRSPTVA